MKQARNNPVRQRLAARLQLNVERDCPLAAPISSRQITRWARAGLLSAYRRAEVSIRVVDAGQSQQLNHDYRGKDAPTNVLTFALNEGEPVPGMEHLLFGDLVLCAPVIEREAAEQGKSIAAHFAHLVIHGMLHLQGYDHDNDADAEAMESLETQIMMRLGYPNPYS